MQDLNYWFDPVGNITEIQDNAQQTLFFNNAVIAPTQKFTYDSIYRLSEAKGRELISTPDFGSEDNWNDGVRQTSHKGDGNAVQNYIQKYTYDAVGNILSLQHIANVGSYTRLYEIETNSNRLLSNTIGANTYTYNYDARGNMTAMPHLSAMNWNAQNELKSIIKGSEPTYYQYASGERIRKFTDKRIIKEERIYLGNFEIYRKFEGGSLKIERQTVHISDDTGRIAMLEKRTFGSAADDNGTEEDLIRYIYSNHLQSASLELDENGAIISYEEYHPYGTTSYQANNSDIKAIAKRYRYTGKERDEESGLYYHGARYYAPWLARWTAVDPLESKYAGMSPYNYCLNNPVIYKDDDGNEVEVTIQGNKIIFSSTVYIYGENSNQLANDFQKAFDDFAQKALQDRVYKEVDKEGNLMKEWDVEIKMVFNEATQEDFDRITNATNELSGENLLIVKNEIGRAEAGKHGINYKASPYKEIPSPYYPNQTFKQSTGDRSTGNIAWLYSGDSGATAVHETFHLFGLGDRYTDASYMKVYDNGKIDYTGGESISHTGWEGDIMSTGDFSLFSQIHIDNLTQKAFGIFKEKNANSFFMGRVVDTANNRDISAIPPTKPIVDITINKQVGTMTNPMYINSGTKDPRKP